MSERLGEFRTAYKRIQGVTKRRDESRRPGIVHLYYDQWVRHKSPIEGPTTPIDIKQVDGIVQFGFEGKSSALNTLADDSRATHNSIFHLTNVYSARNAVGGMKGHTRKLNVMNC